MSKKIGVVLAGCGVFDGAEIHESVLTLLALDRAGATAVCLAPDVAQAHVVNHLTGEPVEGETRNVLVEAARIARGNISDLAGVTAADLHGLVFPGGFGAAKNLCTFAFDGPEGEIHPDVRRLIQEVHAARKPIGLCCIAPALAAFALGGEGVELTIGNDAATAAGLEKLGAQHVDKPVTEAHEDPARKVVTAPAYMYGEARISEVATGIEKVVNTVVAWA